MRSSNQPTERSHPGAAACALIIAGLLFSLPALAIAQDAVRNISPDSTTAAQEAETERVIVTGSNIPSAEEVGPHPVDTYTRDSIAALGVRSATDLVQKLPAATGASLNENTVNGGDGRTEINLRGILPKETLVLQDGRRLAPVGFAGDTVDLNTIPFALIDHIDLLKDGASAIYGADAVAGVLNVFLIHRFRGLELYSSYGNTNLGFANDMGEETAYLLAGTGDEKTDIVVFAEVYNRAAMYSRDIDLSHDTDARPFGGTDMRSPDFPGGIRITKNPFSPTGGFVYLPRLNGGARSPTPHAFPSVRTDPQYVPRKSLPAEQQLFNYADLTPEIPATDREDFYGSLDRKLCDQYLEVFADFKYVRSDWSSGLAPVPFGTDIFTDAAHPTGISPGGFSVPLQNPFNPFTTPDYVSVGGFDPKVPATAISAAPAGTGFTTRVRYRAVEGGLRSFNVLTDNYEFTGGLKGTLAELGDYFKSWQWESAARFNEDHRVERTGGIINNSQLRMALLDTNPATAFNPFGLGQNSSRVLNRVFANTTRYGSTFLENEDAKATGDLFSFPAGPASFALGGEHRREYALDVPDALAASGDTTGAVNFAPTRGSRDVWSIYWELRLPITSSSWKIPGFYSLEFDYQERFEDFSDFGSTERPKFSLRWQPIDSALTLRASYSEAYHAPTLANLFAGAQQFFVDATGLDPRSFETSTVELDFTGNPNLKPETAYEWTYGGAITPGKWWSPLEGLTLTADFYHVDLRAVTVQLDPQFIALHEDEFPSLVIRGPPAVPGDPFGPILKVLIPQLNLGRFVQEGLDYEGVYAFQTKRLGHGDFGTITATVNGTYLSRVQLALTPDAALQNVIGKFGGGFLGSGGGGSFTHNRLYASLFYDGAADSCLAGLDTGFTVSFVGQYWDIRAFTYSNPVSGVAPFDRKVREWTTVSWIFNYTLNFPAPAAQSEVAGYEKNPAANSSHSQAPEKNVQPRSTAEYHACGWRSWLDHTTITLGINNLFDEEPPFVAAAFENNYDEATANPRGRQWYVALKKRF